MTLDEAINTYTSNAEYERTHSNLQGCLDFKQLAEWLKELKDYRERIPSYQVGYNDAKREIALSGEYERAYERGKADAQKENGVDDVLDKIRSEIETERNAGCHTQYAGGLDFALSIIDKYKAESEE